MLPNLSDGGNADGWVEALAKRLYEDKQAKGFIDPVLYRETVNKLMDGMHKGLGGKSFAFEDPRNTLSAYLSENIHRFSAAKGFAEQQIFSKLLLDENGNPRSFVDFRNAVMDAGYQINIGHLQTEYTTAMASAQMAFKWQTFVANGNEVLQYSTVGDDRVRDEHVELDGLTLSIGSPVWDYIFPPNGWNCRCTVIPGVAERITDDAVAGKLGKEKVHEPFRFNPGKEKIILENDHPYYKEAPTELEAVKNYGMPTLEKIYAGELPTGSQLASEAEYRDWWKSQVKVAGTDDILVADKTGIKVLLNSGETSGNNKRADVYFKDHVVLKTAQQRWRYASNVTDVITNPDEVYSVRENGKVVRNYLKFFEAAPVVVRVVDSNNLMVAETMYQLTDVRAVQLRRGVLLYTKK